ncbi:MAG: hypothetical protein WBC19_01760 [Pyrinomonadaceae bacterium]|nr:hypothetical protein [Chloracidobacterium sp.]MBP7415750.1 hypothetical protein [Pyrinomonadaceae bacterium]
MSEPISTAITFLCLGYGALNAYRTNQSAISTTARSAIIAATEVAKFEESSHALFGAKASALSVIRELADEYGMDDWDGEGALAIEALSLWNTEALVRSFPNDLPLPEFAPEPDGAISLDWIQSRHRMFSLSIGAKNRLAYAWIDGTNRGRGVANFDGSNFPIQILRELSPIINYGNVSLRTT